VHGINYKVAVSKYTHKPLEKIIDFGILRAFELHKLKAFKNRKRKRMVNASDIKKSNMNK